MRNASKSRLLVLVLALGLAVAGCIGGGERAQDDPPLPPLGKSLAALQVASDCGDVLAALKAAEVEGMQKLLAQNEAMVLEMLTQGYLCAYPAMEDGNYAGGGVTTSPSGTDKASSYTKTNTQVDGVDEADFVKTDGAFLYVVADGTFQVVDAWPAVDAKKIAEVAVEGTPVKLYVQGDYALVYSQLGAVQTGDSGQGMFGYWGGGYYGGSGECTYGYDCEFTGDGQILKATVLDIADRTAPKVVRETSFSGSYLNSRRIGDVVHTIVVFPEATVPGIAYWPEELTKYEDYCWNSEKQTLPTADQVKAWFLALADRNRDAIATSSIAQYLPGIKDVRHVGGGQTIVEEGLLQACQDFYLSNSGDGKTFLSVVSVDITKLQSIGVSTIVGRPGAVYASPDALYIAQRHQPEGMGGQWFYGEGEDFKEATTVHKFAFDGGTATTYRGSGAVKGHLLNQFAMDELNGYLRIATSMGRVPDPDVYSTVAALKEQNGELVVVGMVDGLAPHEDIRSVRFNGTTGYVVTFKKTDPLFVIDLANPELPVVKGELKIPGYSTYMHMLDDTHILSIGYDADDQGDFAWFAGVQLQVMDVSDLANPKLLHKQVIGTRGSTSDAATNHLAFTFFREKGLLAIPMTVCEGGTGGSFGNQMTFSGLMVFKVGVDAGFQYLGGVSHEVPKDFNDGAACSSWWTQSNSLVKRSIFMEDWVYSIAMDKVLVAPVADLAHPVAQVQF